MISRTIARARPLTLGVLAASFPASAQIVISELDLANSKVELVNVGDTDVDLTGHRWCNRFNGSPSYVNVVAADLDPANSTATGLLVKPGEVITFTRRTADLPLAGGELGLYLPSGSFTRRTTMLDYLNYGNSPGVRDSVADDAPAIWVLDTAIDLSTMGAGDTIQLNFGAPGNEVADYSIAPATLGTAQSLQAPGLPVVVISELDLATSQVELANLGTAAADLTGYRWCNRVNGSPQAYPDVSPSDLNTALSTAPGLVLSPGEVIVFDLDASFLPASGGELGLYLPEGDFGSRAALVDYLNYGTSSGVRDSAAAGDPAIWVLDTAIDLSGAGPGETLQLIPGQPGNEVAHYSVAPSTLGADQSIAPASLAITALGFVDADTFFVEFVYTGTGSVNVTETTDLLAFTDVADRTPVSSPTADRLEFDVPAGPLFFRIQEE